MTNCKVLLTGCFSVGKTSLFNRFLYKKFNEQYHTTIGVKVDKKVVSTPNGDVAIMLWDLAGEMTQNKVPNAYFLGASFILYVLDLSTPFTWENLVENIEYLKKVAPGVNIKIIGNKKDLLSTDDLVSTLEKIPLTLDLTTSAKTGENIDSLFNQIANETLSSRTTTSF